MSLLLASSRTCSPLPAARASIGFRSGPHRARVSTAGRATRVDRRAELCVARKIGRFRQAPICHLFGSTRPTRGCLRRGPRP